MIAKGQRSRAWLSLDRGGYTIGTDLEKLKLKLKLHTGIGEEDVAF